ncbi:tyrosine-type recombinase/integrase [Clostridium felsineum]|uniref:tyrosine-type recombinase/integrase n=1 Tax=Clostridium felsineum TaxID=36839 RepID=UPI00098C34F5|nr:tyrosine-type recombinase/integrase [Clostridium felsineum]URZ18772.1 Tyrosine recombinase XerC [Clostridium felsineum DSM 794]
MGSKKLINVRKSTQKSISELYKEYLNYCISIGQTDGTIVSKTSYFKFTLNKIVNVEGNISTFTQDKLEKHIIMMRKNKYSSNYIQGVVIKSKAFLTWCFNHQYIEKFKIKIPQATQKKKTVYTEEELKKLLKKPNLKTCLVGTYKNWVTVNTLLGTGCRAETLLNILVKDVDFINSTILFRHMKMHKQISVPLSPTLSSVLREYIQLLDFKQDDFLFPKLNKKKMSYDTLHQNISIFCKHRNIQMRGINTFRNTFATLFIKNGNNNIYLLQKLLGHSDIRMTERYINLLPCQMAEDINKYNPLDVLNQQRLSIKRGGKQ